MASSGMFARVTDISPKSVEELKNLHYLKLDSINIGIETAHDPTLERMNKGYHASDILRACSLKFRGRRGRSLGADLVIC